MPWTLPWPSPWPAWMGVADFAALAWFALAWGGYTLFADHSRFHARSITAAMNARRRAWMQEALHRDLRMIDTGILGNLITGVGFFASTTIFVIGGLMAMLGVVEAAAQAIARLPLAVAPQAEALEAKVLLLLVIFTYAFFKFAWAFRLANYCSIAVGGLPERTGADTPGARAKAEVAATLSILSGHHFNRGLRAYFFALAAAGWMVGPLVFILLTATVVGVLHRREFRSRALSALRGGSG